MTFIIYTTTPYHLAPSSTTNTLFEVFILLFFIFLSFFFFFFFDYWSKQDGLAVAFSTTSLTELE